MASVPESLESKSEQEHVKGPAETASASKDPLEGQESSKVPLVVLDGDSQEDIQKKMSQLKVKPGDAESTSPGDEAKEVKEKSEKSPEKIPENQASGEETHLAEGLMALQISPRLSAYKHHAKTMEALVATRVEQDMVARHNNRLTKTNIRRGVSSEDAEVKNSAPSSKQADPADLEEANDPSKRDFVALREALLTSNGDTLLGHVRRLRRMLSVVKQPPIQETIDHGLLPLLAGYLDRMDAPELQLEAAWSLTNVASGSSEQTEAVINVGSVPKFIALLKVPRADVQEQAVWAIGNIAGDSPRLRDLVLAAGGLLAVTSVMQAADMAALPPSMVRQTAWAIGNLLRGKPRPRSEAVSPALPLLLQMLTRFPEDEEIACDACWGFAHFSDGPNDVIQHIIDMGVVPTIVHFLSLDLKVNVLTPALRTIGNIATGDALQTDYIVNLGVLPHIRKLLSHPQLKIRKEAAWTVSNITAGTVDQIQAVIDSEILQELVRILREDRADVQKEAAWALANLTDGGEQEQIIEMARLEGCIAGFKGLMASPDVRIQNVCLTGLEAIFRVSPLAEGGGREFCEVFEELDGVEVIEALQNSEDRSVYERAVRVLETYFAAEAED